MDSPQGTSSPLPRLYLSPLVAPQKESHGGPMMFDLDEVLDRIEEYLENRQDADCVGDPPRYQANEEMRLLIDLQEARRERRITLKLTTACICLDCEEIFEPKNVTCPGCGSRYFVPLGNWIKSLNEKNPEVGRPLGSKKKENNVKEETINHE